LPEITAEPAQYTTHDLKPPASHFVNRLRLHLGLPFQTIADFTGSNQAASLKLLQKQFSRP
jgi:hypothetical protein